MTSENDDTFTTKKTALPLRTPQKTKIAFTVDAVVSSEECDALIGKANDAGWSPSPMAPLQTGLRSRVEDKDFADLLFRRLQKHFPSEHLGRRLRCLTSTLRFIKYDVGAEVSPHPDTAGGGRHTPPNQPNKAPFSLLLFF
mmetsp:Transcript_5947/g.19324  ORF Transcript_5947/g.19324 Transcript_5947/m.19324 type:complete len:141 (+) Transcript_5947:3-425(+)